MTWLAEIESRTGIKSDGRYWRVSRRPLTRERLESAFGLVGRDGAPAVLFDLRATSEVSDEMLAAVLPGVWSGAEFPERLLPTLVWIEWFRTAAYPQPNGPLTLYRGTVPRRARGMAWTTDHMRAGWFANRWGTDLEFDQFIETHCTDEERAAEAARLERAQAAARESGVQQAYVYVATVEPEAVLAIMDDLEPDGRNESEVVVDPRMLPRLKRPT